METNVFRKQYLALTENEKFMVDRIKNKAHDLYVAIDNIGTSRETSLAKTKLEESVMWATKAITG